MIIQETTTLNELHPFTADELTVAHTLQKRGKYNDALGQPSHLKVAYQIDGNFTVAIVYIGTGACVVGCAKRNPTDKTNDKIGQQLALSRALSV